MPAQLDEARGGELALVSGALEMIGLEAEKLPPGDHRVGNRRALVARRGHALAESVTQVTGVALLGLLGILVDGHEAAARSQPAGNVAAHAAPRSPARGPA